MNLAAFKLALQTAPLVTIYGAQVRYTIKDKIVFLEWTGTSSNKCFKRIVTEQSILAGKRVAVHAFAICMAREEETGEIVYEDKLVPVEFFNKLEFPL